MSMLSIQPVFITYFIFENEHDSNKPYHDSRSYIRTSYTFDDNKHVLSSCKRNEH